MPVTVSTPADADPALPPHFWIILPANLHRQAQKVMLAGSLYLVDRPDAV